MPLPRPRVDYRLIESRCLTNGYPRSRDLRSGYTRTRRAYTQHSSIETTSLGRPSSPPYFHVQALVRHSSLLTVTRPDIDPGQPMWLGQAWPRGGKEPSRNTLRREERLTARKKCICVQEQGTVAQTTQSTRCKYGPGVVSLPRGHIIKRTHETQFRDPLGAATHTAHRTLSRWTTAVSFL